MTPPAAEVAPCCKLMFWLRPEARQQLCLHMQRCPPAAGASISGGDGAHSLSAREAWAIHMHQLCAVLHEHVSRARVGGVHTFYVCRMRPAVGCTLASSFLFYQCPPPTNPSASLPLYGRRPCCSNTTATLAPGPRPQWLAGPAAVLRMRRTTTLAPPSVPASSDPPKNDQTCPQVPPLTTLLTQLLLITPCGTVPMCRCPF